MVAEITDLIKEIMHAAEVVRVGKSPDVTGVANLVGAMGQSFTTTMFGFQYQSGLKSDTSFLMALCQQNNEPWVGTVASSLIQRPVNSLRKRYNMTVTADLHERIAKAVKGLSQADLLDVLRALFQYHVFLNRAVRDLLPFYELSVTFEGYKRLAAWKG